MYRHRSRSTNRAFGLLLAFNAGAINAGGFLVLHAYTSHMTGFASQLVDSGVTGSRTLFLSALGAICAFTAGAAACAVLVSWARELRLRAIYAPPLLLEALLLLFFGIAGTVTLAWPTPFTVPMTVLLLSFIMGLQNAVGSKTSRGSIRTTHMTGNITDLGMELGKWAYLGLRRREQSPLVHCDPERVTRVAGLIAMFLLGGLVGALGFQRIGFICVVPLASLLLALSMPPIARERRRAAFCWMRQPAKPTEHH
ncbi:uncharacterized membrane protein YoaK (UPF0700 family) [Acidovorax soli]|uniref:Uncharacterized membrane protein YoaK (UPF0700 family) n=2 Tax=Acidovorax soli TaxID=592050 RepID=A0A7X0U873_9BURK|nr:uncharacterized membrane protein YoaK (UPF0700 family) [Acidovorax soli]